MAFRVRRAVAGRLWRAVRLAFLPAAAAKVTVDGQGKHRHGNFHRAQLPVNNNPGQVGHAVKTMAVEPQGGVLPDLPATIGGHYFRPQSPEAHTYDPDDNRPTDGRWRHAGDCEQHLVPLQPLAVAAGKIHYIRNI